MLFTEVSWIRRSQLSGAPQRGIVIHQAHNMNKYIGHDSFSQKFQIASGSHKIHPLLPKPIQESCFYLVLQSVGSGIKTYRSHWTDSFDPIVPSRRLIKISTLIFPNTPVWSIFSTSLLNSISWRLLFIGAPLVHGRKSPDARRLLGNTVSMDADLLWIASLYSFRAR